MNGGTKTILNRIKARQKDFAHLIMNLTMIFSTFISKTRLFLNIKLSRKTSSMRIWRLESNKSNKKIGNLTWWCPQNIMNFPTEEKRKVNNYLIYLLIYKLPVYLRASKLWAIFQTWLPSKKIHLLQIAARSNHFSKVN